MPEERKPPTPHRWRGFWIFVIVLLAVNWLTVLLAQPSGQPRVKIAFSPFFLSEVQADQVKSISSKADTISGTFTTKVRYPPGDTKATPTTLFSTQVPAFWNNNALTALLQQHNVQVNAQNPNPGTSLLAEILLGFGPTLLLVGLFVLLARRARAGAGGLGGLGNFGRSQARRVDPEKIRVTFDDVAGIDEAKSELTEIVDFLKTPERYRAPGRADPSRGAAVRLARHGQDAAGTGGGRRGARGVLLDRRLGVHRGDRRCRRGAGAGPVRQGQGGGAVDHLHRRARRDRPLAPGLGRDHRRQRRARADAGPDPDRDGRLRVNRGGGRARRDQPAGDPRPGAAAPGALRPPRRRAATRPGGAARRSSQVHTRSMPLAEDVDLDALASTTPGMVGADLANLANEAALLAARRDHDKVQMADFTDSLEKILLGAPRGIVLSPEDRERTAYHESGHALVGMLTPGADPVRKVSIIPRGQALGVTLSTPDSDRVSYSREELEAKIRVALGGRVGRRGRLRQDHHRRRVRHPAADPDRPPDGRPLGDEREARSDHRAAHRRRGTLLPRRQRDLAPDPVANRRGGPPDRRRCPRRGHPTAHRAPRATRQPRPRAPRSRDAGRPRRLRRGRRPNALSQLETTLPNDPTTLKGNETLMSSGSENSQRYSAGTHDGSGDGRRHRTRRWYRGPKNAVKRTWAGFDWAYWPRSPRWSSSSSSVASVAAFVRRAERRVRTCHVSRT